MPNFIDKSRTDLAREFHTQPYGRHSPDLEAVLDRLRMVNPNGKFMLVCTQRGREWTVAHLTDEPPRAVLHRELVFDNTPDAERAVFRLRWKIVTGSEPNVD
jgi:hypothetical protein